MAKLPSAPMHKTSDWKIWLFASFLWFLIKTILDWYSEAKSIQFHRWTVSNFKQFGSCLLNVQKRPNFNMLDHPFGQTVEVVDCYVTKLNIATNRPLSRFSFTMFPKWKPHRFKWLSSYPWVMFRVSENYHHPFLHFSATWEPQNEQFGVFWYLSCNSGF